VEDRINGLINARVSPAQSVVARVKTLKILVARDSPFKEEKSDTQFILKFYFFSAALEEVI
jgi:hypothetical protein